MIDITRGADESVLIELFEDDEVTPMDLTAATAVVVHEATISPTLTVTDAANGQITASFDSADTEDLKKDGRYSFRVKISFGTDDEVTPDFVVFAR
jgi:hypothetical protein